MAWLRIGDDASTYPRLLQIEELPDCDPRLRLEVFGFLTALATQCAGHLTDYVFGLGQARMQSPRAEYLLEVAARVELVYELEVEGRRVWRIHEDADFIHMRSEEEVTRDRQRKRDNSNQDLIVPVRIRDGDQCRYCGKTVSFGDRKSARGGTYDHREGVSDSTSVDTLVVACRQCNSARGDDRDADTRIPLLPAPKVPYYSKSTAGWINASSWARSHNVVVPASSSGPCQERAERAQPVPRLARPGRKSSTTERAERTQPVSRLARPGVEFQHDRERAERAQPVPRLARPDHVDLADLTEKSRSDLDIEATTSGFAGSGLDGSGGVGKGRHADSPVPVGSRRGKRRRKRKRKRST